MRQEQKRLAMVWIPPGYFFQGADEEDWRFPGISTTTLMSEKRKNTAEAPRHQVEISNGFWMTVTPVTVRQYRDFTITTQRAMPKAPWFDRGWEREDHPMVNVRWDEAMAFAQWAGGTLPTEAQWEYAARNGNRRIRYPWGDTFDENKLWEGWHNPNQGTASVERTNNIFTTPWGLKDLAGNVWEWCIDWFGPYQEGMSRDPRGSMSGTERVVRGGAFTSNLRLYDPFRCAYRLKRRPHEEDANCGFRVVFPSEPNKGRL